MNQPRVPTAELRHLLSRFSYGVTPALVKQGQAAGGGAAWLDRQLDHRSIPDDAADAMRGWFPYLDKTPGELEAEAERPGGRQGWETGVDLQRWSLLRRVASTRQVHEQMVEFWSNLLHVPSPEPKCWPLRPEYDRVVREHALGRFEDMLVECVLHPAMGCYLDNALSTAKSVNENLGREVLELHTVGIEAGFDEAMVRDSAYILTGWQCDRFGTWERFYAPEHHKTGPVRVLGFSDQNQSADGREMSRQYLRYLANHPSTARRVARRLAVRFVSDEPSAALVTHVANAFTSSGTDIKTTLRALVAHPEFAASVGQKTRTPTEDGIATYRALGVQVRRPTRDDDAANVIAHQISLIGQAPFDWARPDGFPDVADAWTSTSRMLGSWQVHWSLSGGYWPRSGVAYRPRTAWLPKLPARFDEVVDHMSRQLLARPASKRMQQAASTYTGLSPRTRIAKPDDLSPFRLTKVLSTLLDTPAHMSR